jgi:hypothetical protein
MLFLCFPRGEVELPIAQKGVLVFIEESAADVLSKNTSVFIFNEEMLLQA